MATAPPHRPRGHDPAPRDPDITFPRIVLEEGREPGHDYSPFIYLRYDAGDDGNQKQILGGTEQFWESPDVWVVSSAGVNQRPSRSSPPWIS